MRNQFRKITAYLAVFPEDFDLGRLVMGAPFWFVLYLPEPHVKLMVLPGRMYKNLRLILTFYKSFAFATSLITLISAGIFYEYGLGIFHILFWLKVITSALVFYFIKSFKAREFYYYQNLGLSKRILWSTSMALDFFLFFFALILTYKIR